MLQDNMKSIYHIQLKMLSSVKNNDRNDFQLGGRLAVFNESRTNNTVQQLNILYTRSEIREFPHQTFPSPPHR